MNGWIGIWRDIAKEEDVETRDIVTHPLVRAFPLLGCSLAVDDDR